MVAVSGKESAKTTLLRMDESLPFFWMNGLLATDLIEISSDIKEVERGGFWAVSISFEGQAIFARFGKVETNKEFPQTKSWNTLDSLWKSSLESADFCNYVAEIRHKISLGVVYQTNACRVLSTAPVEESLDSLFSELLSQNFAAHASFLRIPGLEVASASPELFLLRAGNNIKTSPIKGTQGLDVQWEFGAKDKSENTMIVDLMRNDLGRICEIGSIEVSDFLRSENHPGVRHLVSDIKGILRPEVSWRQIIEALLPPGSVSGTPKSSALEIILRNEPVARDIYCGVLGWIDGEQSTLSVAIRTFWRRENALYFGTGGGITWPSDPHSEWRETQLKANRLVGIAGGVDAEGWQFGSGIFETILIQDGKPILFDKHMERAEKSGRELAINIPPRSVILRAIDDLDKPVLARLRLSFGSQFSLSMAPYIRSMKPIRVAVQRTDTSPGIGPHKKFPYWENLDLQRSANQAGFDEILLIGCDGTVGEGATSNFLFKISGKWITPPLSSGVLPGIMRGLALDRGLASEAKITEADLHDVEAMVALSSLRICTAVGVLDERELVVSEETQSLFDILWAAAQADSVG